MGNINFFSYYYYILQQKIAVAHPNAKKSTITINIITLVRVYESKQLIFKIKCEF